MRYSFGHENSFITYTSDLYGLHLRRIQNVTNILGFLTCDDRSISLTTLP